MNLKTGDRVRFLNETGEGKISGFQDNNVALVTTDDGFEIPTLIKELVKIEDGLYDNESEGMKETVVSEQNIDINSQDDVTIKEESGLYLAFVKKGPDTYTINLVNDSDYIVQYVLASVAEGRAVFISKGPIEDNTKVIIRKSNLEAIRSLGSILFQGIMSGNKNFEVQTPVNRIIDLEKTSFQDKVFIENDFFNERALIIKLENDDLEKEINKLSSDKIQKIIKEKEPVKQTVGDFLKKKKKEDKPDYEEVDLHIESIVDDFSDMTPGEIINAQLSRFEISLDGAVRNNQRRIIFIHGIGNGKLKYEMSKIIDRKYPDLKYQDASFKEYGYGAMMVIIK